MMTACFGTIRNNTALKQLVLVIVNISGFWNHSKQHSSKTDTIFNRTNFTFWNHSKQHSSKTLKTQ